MTGNNDTPDKFTASIKEDKDNAKDSPRWTISEAEAEEWSNEDSLRYVEIQNKKRLLHTLGI